MIGYVIYKRCLHIIKFEKNIYVEKDFIPKHIGIIMDGNGRWASARGLPREAGHIAGVKAFRNIVRYIQNTGIKYFTFYVFSKENWNRPSNEVLGLMSIFKNQLESLIKDFKENIKINFIGDKLGLSHEIIELEKKVEEMSKENNGMILNLAINYSGRSEIVSAVLNLAKKICDKKINQDEVSEEVFEKFLYTKGQPDLDLVIRTGGELRLSNFLIWQSAYAEFVVVKKFWPDFSCEDFDCAIKEFMRRERRFGGI
ncbi:MAG: di-trans,poly-cis-decaprenylcistransferase [Oscillospiraceae bacterium]|nr:di-trans,poly-cis-decaprenylcistransferase [Oscillospiraceae bacterium]